jgi:hypothetical protein
MAAPPNNRPPNRPWQKNIAALSLVSTEGIPQLSANIQTKVMEFLSGKKTKAAINTPRKLMERAKFAYEIGTSANMMRHGRMLPDFLQGELQLALQRAQDQAQYNNAMVVAAEEQGDYRYAEILEQQADEYQEEVLSLEHSIEVFQTTGRLPDTDVRWLYALITNIDESYPPEFQEAKADWLTILRQAHPDVLGAAGGRRKTRKARKTRKSSKKN